MSEGAGMVARAAPAKLNLALAVDRPDGRGMHPICSWMVPITLHDDVHARRLPGDAESSLSVRWASDALRPTPIDWAPEQDLAARAHRALETRIGRTLPAELTITKRIPTQSGLGGGSSDAAASLLALRELFGLDVGDEDLASIGHSLGSDVPFFLGPDPAGAAIVRNLGEDVERGAPPRTPDAEILLIVPSVSCSTGAVYQAFDHEPPRAFRRDEVEAMARSGVIDAERLFNDLSAPAMRVQARLREARNAAADALGAPVHLTGSGAALFATLAGRPVEERSAAVRRAGEAVPGGVCALVGVR